MAITPISYIKARFQTGDKPTEQDYSDLIDTASSMATDLGSAGNNENIIYGIENQTIVDSFITSDWRWIKYIVSIKHESLNKFYATELSILIDGNDLNISEYGVLDNDGNVGTIDVSKDQSGVINLTIIPDPAIRPVTVRFARMGLKA
jgi:hypothetical protein